MGLAARRSGAVMDEGVNSGVWAPPATMRLTIQLVHVSGTGGYAPLTLELCKREATCDPEP